MEPETLAAQAMVVLELICTMLLMETVPFTSRRAIGLLVLIPTFPAVPEITILLFQVAPELIPKRRDDAEPPVRSKPATTSRLLLVPL